MATLSGLGPSIGVEAIASAGLTLAVMLALAVRRDVLRLLRGRRTLLRQRLDRKGLAARALLGERRRHRRGDPRHVADPDPADGHAAELHGLIPVKRHPPANVGCAVDTPDAHEHAAHRLPRLVRFGYTIGVGEDEIHAVIDAEAAGSGFDKLKRPKMLFEPHRFYANLSGEKRARAVSLGLAYPNWKRDYPADSYPRLSQAMTIDETAALKSASWGLGQIMGENYVAAGYDSPQHMVVAFVESGEGEHLGAMVRFIVENHLDDEIRAHNWAAFARGYNGPKYAENGYHTKLAAAYAKWAKIPDTPWSPTQDAIGKAVPVPPVEVSPLPAPLPTSTPPLVAPAPRNSGSPTLPVVIPEPAPVELGFWATIAARLRAAYPRKDA